MTEPKKAVHISAAGGPLVVINNISLVIATLLGTWGTVYADLFPQSSLGELRLSLAVGWVLCIVIALYLLGHQKEHTDRPPLDKIALGFKIIKENAGYAFMVIFMASAAALCVYGKYKPQSNGDGLLKGLVAASDRIERISTEARDSANRAATAAESSNIKSDVLIAKTTKIETALTRPLSPKETLAKQGIAWEEASFRRALINSDYQTIALFIKGDWNVLARAANGDGNALGQFARLAKVEDEVKTIQIIQLLAKKIDLTKPVAQFNGAPPMNLTSNAISSCNLRMLQALSKSGVDIHIVDRPTVMNPPFPPYKFDLISQIRHWDEPRAIPNEPCPSKDREEILRLVLAA